MAILNVKLSKYIVKEPDEPISNFTNFKVGQKITAIQFNTKTTPNFSKMKNESLIFAKSLDLENRFGLEYSNITLNGKSGNVLVIIDLKGSIETNIYGGSYIVYSEIDGKKDNLTIVKGWNTELLDENGIYKPHNEYEISELNLPDNWNGQVVGAVESQEYLQGMTSLKTNQIIGGFDFGNVQNGETSQAMEEFLKTLSYKDGRFDIVEMENSNINNKVLLSAFEDNRKNHALIFGVYGGEYNVLYSDSNSSEFGERGWQNLIDGKAGLQSTNEIIIKSIANLKTSWNGVLIGAVENAIELQTNGTKLENIILNEQQFVGDSSQNARYTVIDNPVLYSNGEEVKYTDDITANFEITFSNENGTFTENATININEHADNNIGNNKYIYFTIAEYDTENLKDELQIWIAFNCSGVDFSQDELFYDADKTLILVMGEMDTILEAKLVQANKIYVEPIEPVDIYLDEPITVQANGLQDLEGMAKVRFTPTATATYSLTSNSEYDTYGYLYDSNGNIIASDDDSAGNGNFKITQELVAGETYIYAVRFYDANKIGEMELLLTKAVADLTPFEVGQTIKGFKFDTSKQPDLSQILGEELMALLINYDSYLDNSGSGYALIADMSAIGGSELAGKRVIWCRRGTSDDFVYCEEEFTFNGTTYNQGWNYNVLDENGEYNFDRLKIVAGVGSYNNWNGVIIGANVLQGTTLLGVALQDIANFGAGLVVDMPLKDINGNPLEPKGCNVDANINYHSYNFRLMFTNKNLNGENLPIYVGMFESAENEDVEFGIITYCGGIDNNVPIYDTTKAFLYCRIDGSFVEECYINDVTQKHLEKLQDGETLIGISFDTTYTREEIVKLFENIYGESSFTDTGEIHDLITTTDGYRLYVSTIKYNGNNEVRIINELNGVDDVHNTLIYTSNDFANMYEGWHNIGDNGYVQLNGVTISALNYADRWNGLFIGKEEE